MHTTFTCSSCHRTIAAQVPPGSRVQCPLCQQVVVVPVAAAGDAPVPLTLDGGPAAQRPFDSFNPNQPMYGPPPVPGHYGYGSFAVKSSSGLAVAALVCGILSILGLCMWGMGAIVGLVALGLGIGGVVQVRRQPQRLSGKGMAIAGIIMGCLSIVAGPVLVFMVMVPMMSGLQTFSQRMICFAQVHNIYGALQNYAAQDQNGMYPDDITKLFKLQTLSSSELTCPDDKTGGQSYYYVPGYGKNSSATQVIAYEHPDVHKADSGGHVLNNNGNVSFETGAAYQRIISNIKTPDGKRFAPHEP